LYDTNWTLISASCEVSNILCSKHGGVTQAQDYGYQSYDTCIFNFLVDVFNNDEQTGLLLIHEIISQTRLNEEQEIELKKILLFFDNDDKDSLLILTNLVGSNSKFIDLINYPDDFYKELIEEINFQYANKHSMSLSILIRKLFENLIIDILRKKYGTGPTDLPLYYETSKRRFHDFSVLLKNLESKQADFHYISPNINDTFMRELNEYREYGNAGAHSIDVNMKVEYFTGKKEDINHKVRLLIRVFNSII
jgi:hypothetical protein